MNFGGFCFMSAKLGEVRANARLAFSRLAGGFWEDKIKEREEVKGREATEFLVMKTREQIGAGEGEREFYNAVRAAYFAGVSALTKLLDKGKLATLTEIERQRYIFNLSARINEVINEIKQEEQLLAL